MTLSGRSQYVAAGGERTLLLVSTRFCARTVGLIAPVSDIAAANHVSIHQYADDIQT